MKVERLSELALQAALWLGTLAASVLALIALGFTLKVLWRSFQFGWGLL